MSSQIGFVGLGIMGKPMSKNLLKAGHKLVVFDVVAPPILYSCALFPELLEMTAEDCRKRVVRRHRADALEIAWPPMALADLDVPEDVDRVRSEFEGS